MTGGYGYIKYMYSVTLTSSKKLNDSSFLLWQGYLSYVSYVGR
jgi:hypothetical protein